MASRSPDTTHSDGALMVASHMPSPSIVRTRLSGNGTATITPSSICSIKRPRRATSRSASGSSSTPEMHAATNSPMLCPRHADGLTPQLIHSLASAYSVTNSAD